MRVQKRAISGSSCRGPLMQGVRFLEAARELANVAVQRGRGSVRCSILRGSYGNPAKAMLTIL